MGISYSFYLEASVDNKWCCVCPQYKNRDGEISFHTIIDGKSYLHEVVDDFAYERGVEPSEELKGDYMTFYLFDSEKAKKYITMRYNENKGYVLKDEMERFIESAGDGSSGHEIYEWLQPDEFAALSQELQKAYVYFEWTNSYQTLEILKRIDIVANKFRSIYERQMWMVSNSDRPTAYRIVVGVG